VKRMATTEGGGGENHTGARVCCWLYSNDEIC
jgi:hypothetical protein